MVIGGSMYKINQFADREAMLNTPNKLSLEPDY